MCDFLYHFRYHQDRARLRLYNMAPKPCTTVTGAEHGAIRCYQNINTAFSGVRLGGGSRRKGKAGQKGTSSAVIGHSVNIDTKMKLDEKVRARESQGNVSTFLRNKYSEDAQAAKNWDDFYSRHRTNFFKDRHYMEDEFPELERARVDNKPRTLLEAGCGVGNTVLPLLASHSGLEIFATDFSPKAIQLLNSTPLPASAKQRMHAFVSDMSLDSTASVWEEEILQKVPGGLDIVMMIFSLSAVPPERQTVAIRNIAKVMKPGGKLLFRDYARCDHTQLKFSHENRLENNFYVRQDGTLTYFFDLSALVKTFREFGFKAVDTRHVERVIANRSTGAQMTRIWIHGTFEYTG